MGDIEKRYVDYEVYLNLPSDFPSVLPSGFLMRKWKKDPESIYEVRTDFGTTEYHYDQDRCRTYPAPSYDEVQWWLRESKSLDVHAWFDTSNCLWGYRITAIDIDVCDLYSGFVDYKEKGTYNRYEDALRAAVLEALLIAKYEGFEGHVQK